MKTLLHFLLKLNSLIKITTNQLLTKTQASWLR